MNVLVDWDSTTNQFDKHMRESINQKYGYNFQHQDINSWDFYRTVLNDEEHEWVWGNEVFDNREWNLALAPHERALEALDLMMEYNLHPYIISQRASHHQQWIRDWFESHGYDLPVYVSSATGNTKSALALKHNLKVAVEDSPHGAGDLAKRMPVYLINTPWNQQAKHPNIIRVPSLYDAAVHMVEMYGS